MKLLLGLMICAAVCGGARAQDEAARRETARLAAVIDPIVQADLRASGAPGVGVVVVHGGRVVLMKSYGLADREAGLAADAQTVWPIASVTKLLTAILVMQQVDAGRMRLDADVGAYLKTLTVPPGDGRPITVADLLRHTSGLDELAGRQVERPDAIPPLARFLDGKLVRWRPAGGYTSYSTYGMALAAAAAEDVTGQPFSVQARTHIFAPLGMTGARVMVRSEDALGVAAPYALKGGQATRIAYEWYATPPTSSAALSLTDASRLLLDLTAERPRLLPRARLDQMMRQQSTLSPAVPGWGYGFQLDRLDGRSVAEHGGDIGGFASLLSVLPRERLAIFVVGHGEGSSLRFKVRDAAVRALYPAPPVTTPPAVATDLAPFLGLYRASYQCHSCKPPGGGPEFRVERDGAGGVTLWGSHWRPIGHDVFAEPETGRRLAFLRDPAGEVTAVSGGAWRVGERVRETP